MVSTCKYNNDKYSLKYLKYFPNYGVSEDGFHRRHSILLYKIGKIFPPSVFVFEIFTRFWFK